MWVSLAYSISASSARNGLPRFSPVRIFAAGAEAESMCVTVPGTPKRLLTAEGAGKESKALHHDAPPKRSKTIHPTHVATGSLAVNSQDAQVSWAPVSFYLPGSGIVA